MKRWTYFITSETTKIQRKKNIFFTTQIKWCDLTRMQCSMDIVCTYSSLKTLASPATWGSTVYSPQSIYHYYLIGTLSKLNTLVNYTYKNLIWYWLILIFLLWHSLNDFKSLASLIQKWGKNKLSALQKGNNI